MLRISTYKLLRIIFISLCLIITSTILILNITNPKIFRFGTSICNAQLIYKSKCEYENNCEFYRYILTYNDLIGYLAYKCYNNNNACELSSRIDCDIDRSYIIGLLDISMGLSNYINIIVLTILFCIGALWISTEIYFIPSPPELL